MPLLSSFLFSTLLGLVLADQVPVSTSSPTPSSHLQPSNPLAMKCKHPEQWFTQSIDHFGGSNETFQQKFYVSTEFYKPGGPILYFQGEETSVLDCVESTILYDFAKSLNAVVAIMEHRYFGESKPFAGNETNYTNAQWKYLTLDNVMEDAVQFVTTIRRNVTGSDEAPIFTASGSYGGFLMTMFRQNHPDTFTGVIASAPVLRSFYGAGDVDIPGQYHWWDRVSQIYQEQSFEAAQRIENAFETLVKRFASNNISSLQEELGLCSPVKDNSSATLATITGFLRFVFSDATEFNYNVARPGRSAFANPLSVFLEIILSEADPMRLLKRTNFAWYKATAASIDMDLTCLNFTSAAELTLLTAPILEALPFSYITCSYVSFDDESISNDNIFQPSVDFSHSYPLILQYCQEEFGVSAPSAQSLYEKYHFTTAELQNSTGIIFSLGQLDPVTAVSGYYDFALPNSGKTPYSSRWIYTSGMAHREDLFAWTNQTKENVRKTNLEELEIIKGWMAVAGSPRRT